MQNIFYGIVNDARIMHKFTILISVMLCSIAWTQHFQPAYQDELGVGNPYLPMNFYIPSAMIDGVNMTTGDEIGIFDGDVCVGAGILEGEFNEVIQVPASADDPLTSETDGFVNTLITYKLWDDSEGIEITDVEPTYYDSDGNLIDTAPTFALQGTAGVSLTGSNLANDISLYTESYNIHNIYPNPFNSITNITYDLPVNSQIKIEVFDISGQKVQSLLNSFQILGFHSIKWDASSLSSGLYFLQLKTDNYIETRKITYLK